MKNKLKTLIVALVLIGFAPFVYAVTTRTINYDNGNYGIGTESPSTTLEVNGTTTTTNLIVTGNSNKTAITVCGNGACDQTTDGTADDVQIQSAIDSLPSTGGKVFIREGTYNISSPITINRDSIVIQGAGKATILRLVDNFNDYMFKIDDATLRYYLTFTDMKLDGNQANQTGGGTIMASSTARSLFKNLWFEQCEDICLSIGGMSDNTYGFHNVVADNVFNQISGTGLYIRYNDENFIQNNLFNYFSAYGIQNDAGLQRIEGNTFVGNGATGIGYFGNWVSNDSIINNTFDSIPQESIIYNGTANNIYGLISGNIIFKSGTQGAGDPAIAVGNGRGLTVSNNIVTSFGTGDNYTYAYEEISGINNVTLIGNQFGAGSLGTYSFNASYPKYSIFNGATSTPSADVTWIDDDGTGNLQFNASTTKSIDFSVGNVEYATISATGLGIGVTNPQSLLQIGTGYLQIDNVTASPPSADCDNATETGRMKFDSVNDLLYICSGASGWVSK